MKKGRKGCLVIFMICIGLFLIYNFYLTKAEKENRHRTNMAVISRDGIKDYYLKQQEYPEEISTLQLQHKNLIEEYIQAGVLEYARDPTGDKWFTLTCRFSGILANGDSNHSMSWSGIQFSNEVEELPLPAGENPEQDKNGFYFADFH